MPNLSNLKIRRMGALSLGLALSLAACEQEERIYEPGATDISEGELIVATPAPGAPDPELPETPMTPVPEDTAEVDQMGSTR